MRHRVVIAGGGIGALEGLLALQELAGPRVEISVLTAARFLALRTLSVEEPFGLPPGPRHEWDEIARDRGVRWIPDTLARVRTDARTVETLDGPPVHYDALLLALGAKPVRSLPGALTFSGPRDVLALREAIEALDPARGHRIVFAAVAGTTWTRPLYELALATAEHGRRSGLALEVELVTAEPAPVAQFGAEAGARVKRRLAAAGVRVRTGASPTGFADGHLLLESGDPLPADLAVALPVLLGTPIPGVPHDEQGFVPVDGFGRVRGVEHIWAVGDMTTRSPKQGGLAAQQADVAAADIASLAGASVAVTPYRPVLQGLLLAADDSGSLERRRPSQKVVARHAGPYLDRLEAAHRSGRS